jgi:hypothetical protein
MTFVGKLFVILNFLFSAAVTALIAITFGYRTDWKVEYTKLKDKAEAVQRESEDVVNRIARERDGKDEDLKLVRKSLEEARASQAVAEKEKVAVQDQLAKAESLNKTETLTHQKYQVEVQNLKAERDLLVKERTEKDTTIAKITADLFDQKKVSVQNELNFKSQLSRNDRLLTDYEKILKERDSLKSQMGTGLSGGRTPSVLEQPPPQAPRDVRGVVTAATKDGLAQISIGSDSGLQVGNVLQVYRLDVANPKGSVYLGELTVKRVEPKAAVGQFKGVSSAKGLQGGEQVAASITGR